MKDDATHQALRVRLVGFTLVACAPFKAKECLATNDVILTNRYQLWSWIGLIGGLEYDIDLVDILVQGGWGLIACPSLSQKVEARDGRV